MDIKKIENVSAKTEQAIQRKSAYALPDRPSESGMRADEIKKAFYSSITDKNDSVLSELKRVVNESNNIFEEMQGEINDKLTKNDIDKELSNESESAVQNKVLYNPVVFAESERQKSKNLFKVNNNAGYSITRNGVTATVNDDYTITLNGTCTGTTWFNIFDSISVGSNFSADYPKLYLNENKSYTYLYKKISGSATRGTDNIIMSISFRQTNGTTLIENKSTMFDVEDDTVAINYKVKSGVDYLNNGYFSTRKDAVYNNYTFGLMICEGEDTDYQAYNGAIVHEQLLKDALLNSNVNNTIDLRNLSTYDEVYSKLLTTINGRGFGSIGKLDETNNFKTLLPPQPLSFLNYTTVIAQIKRNSSDVPFIQFFAEAGGNVNAPIYYLDVHRLSNGSWVVSGWYTPQVLETVYDASSNNSNINWGYTSGIKASEQVDGVLSFTSPIALNVNKKYRIYVNFGGDINIFTASVNQFGTKMSGCSAVWAYLLNAGQLQMCEFYYLSDTKQIELRFRKLSPSGTSIEIQTSEYVYITKIEEMS